VTARLTDGRLGSRPSPLLVEHVNAIELTDELADAESFVLIDLAHALMLTRQGIFDRRQGRAVVAALLRLLEGDTRGLLGHSPEIGTITLHIERYLERECGPGGMDIQRARSRIDQNATGLRMADRRGSLTVLRHLVLLAETLLAASAEHDEVLAPGYTHLQHAQPTTLGHYFNAHYWTTSRNLSRQRENFQRINESPLGGAAHSGTSWPIDRDLTARYLGFSRPIPNARDAGMSAMDSGAELAAALGLTLSGLSRCASDLYYWSSSEVGLVRLHPSLCGTSSMMPQKRNPIALERIRALAGDAAGWSASQLGLLHFASSTDADQGYVRNPLPAYCHETAGAVALLTEAIDTLEIDEAALAASAARNWSATSALADDLVDVHGLSYRAAHELVARLVTAHEDAGAGEQLRADLVAKHLEGYSLERVVELLDPWTFVRTRTSSGGTAEARRKELAALADEDLSRHRRQLAGLESSVDEAMALLLADARALLDA
jgi:argininosuccinate lyase